MVRFNSDIIFIDTSGQVRSRDGDLTLRADDTGQRDVIVGSGRSLRPEHASIDLGLSYLPWRHLYAEGGSFTSRPTVNGSGVLLQGEDIPLAYACYTVDESVDFVTFTGTFTPVRWNQLDFEDSTVFSRTNNNERIHLARTGLYKITYSAVAQKESNGRGTSEWEVEINNVGTAIRAARAYIYHHNSGSHNIGTTSKTFIREFTAGDFIEIQGAVLTGGGVVGVSDGTTITLELIRLT